MCGSFMGGMPSQTGQTMQQPQQNQMQVGGTPMGAGMPAPMQNPFMGGQGTSGAMPYQVSQQPQSMMPAQMGVPSIGQNNSVYSAQPYQNMQDQAGEIARQLQAQQIIKDRLMQTQRAKMIPNQQEMVDGGISSLLQRMGR